MDPSTREWLDRLTQDVHEESESIVYRPASGSERLEDDEILAIKNTDPRFVARLTEDENEAIIRAVINLVIDNWQKIISYYCGDTEYYMPRIFIPIPMKEACIISDKLAIVGTRFLFEFSIDNIEITVRKDSEDFLDVYIAEPHHFERPDCYIGTLRGHIQRRHFEMCTHESFVRQQEVIYDLEDKVIRPLVHEEMDDIVQHLTMMEPMEFGGNYEYEINLRKHVLEAHAVDHHSAAISPCAS